MRDGLRLRDRCRSLPPACFAPVMATGIVSRALNEAGARTASTLLFACACALYAVLLVASGAKALFHPAALQAELADPARVFGHFTFVAASGVLATRLSHGPARGTAYVLLAVAGAAWAVLAAGLTRLPRSAAREADGTWFLATVGLQSLVLCLTSLPPRPVLVPLAFALWWCGVLLYAGTATVLGRRLLRHPPGPARCTPAYWVTMGAVAISTLAGTQLHDHEDLLPHAARGTLALAVVVLWSWATVLVPPLLATGCWRHLHHRVPLAYEPALWCVVFPVGMYATATARVTATLTPHAPGVAVHLLAWVAAAVWLTVQGHAVAARRPARP
ncbi:tellurite resistance/C4-dicarboxylate transporter family protein [Streptomyces sp. MNP-20]|uniref:tellurite resistance/C4-dicarboxylate transporter family protein n=1 Tax=Streptomyces sp. MNP-20 TaxID=2721165 RepID=UPI002815D8A0|nr:tellurite resistance/C4-dicarboxylate transporter family protein [Streptomyces sp. MNP-20]